MNKCIKCEKELEIITMTNTISSGTEVNVNCQYGSEFDGESFKIFVCDDCLKASGNKSSKYLVKLEVEINADDWVFDNFDHKENTIQNVINDEKCLKVFDGCKISVEDVQPI
jgi:hypothetical protein